ncbi:MAG: ATP-binding protein [Gallionellaceae bacterium]|jgi:signal transduction histidine kinase
MMPRSKSLRTRITLWFGAFVAFSMVLLGGIVAYRLITSLNATLEEHVKEQATADANRLAQRFDYVLESAQVLAKNPLLINGISDSQARQTNLPPLVANFMAGRDVLAVALLDFDGRPVYSSLPDLPTYQGSNALRTALNQGVIGQEIDLERKQWRLFVPVIYYNTTQGALLVDFDLPGIAARILTSSADMQQSLLSQGKVLYASNNKLTGDMVMERRYLGEGSQEALSHLGLELDVVMSRDHLLAPANSAIRDVALLGLLLTALAIALASWFGHRLAQPILTLRDRVALADGTPERRCAPLGTDDELEELAKQFDQRAEALREGEERLQLATRAADIGVWDWDIVNNQLKWDECMYRLYRTQPEDFSSDYDAWMRCVHPDDAKMVNDTIQAALRGENEYRQEFRIIWPDSSVRVIQTASKTFRDPKGTPLRMIGTNIDITERKQEEEEIRQLNQALEQRVSERTAQLEAANKELEAFSYSVSHDLRTPLRAIAGFSRILLEDYENKLDSEGKRLLNVVCDNTYRMGQLIDDILNFSRTGRLELNLTGIDMEQLAREVYAELQLSVATDKLQLEIDTIPSAQGDRAMMHQVFANLLSNAIKFSRNSQPPRIRVGAYVEGNEAIYFVQDNGIGFDMQYVDKLFGVFQRLHSVTEFEGTGIGLAIVKRIITRHGGRVWAEGKVSEGTTIYFALPTKEKLHG